MTFLTSPKQDTEMGGKNPQTDQKEMFLFAFKAVHADQTKPVREA